MSKLKTVIVDDEPNAIELIEHYLLRFFEADIEVVGKFELPLEAFHFLKHHEVDLVFFDINMPELDGMELLELFPNRSFEAVFVTAHGDQALRAFDNAALSYIMKPIDRKAFVSLIGQTIHRVRKMQLSPPLAANSANHSLVTISVPVNGLNTLIHISNVLYFKAEGSYTSIVTETESFLISKNLKHVTQNLECPELLRVNRSFIINLNHVSGYSRANDGTIVMKTGYEVGISRSRKRAVLAILSERIQPV